MRQPPLLRLTDAGLFCEVGNFYIDPWQPVERAVITHAHGDHAKFGSVQYYTSEPGLSVARMRLQGASLVGVPYGQRFELGPASLSLHPAGHILGSAQVRVECDGEVWVVSGDYKRNPDPTCAPFEVVPCDVFISESTFGFPIYRWESGETLAREILAWWDSNRASGVTSLLFCYALGKAQRLLAELSQVCDREVFVHGAMESLTDLYRREGIKMLPTTRIGDETLGKSFAGELVIAPPSAYRSPWMKRFRNLETAFASGWMQVRGARRHRGYDRGFVVSDHADWNDLIRTIEETQARKVFVTHGQSSVLTQFLREKGIDAETLTTHFGDTEEIG